LRDGDLARALPIGRRQLVFALLGTLAREPRACAQEGGGRRFRLAFANLNEEPGVRLEGLGFTGIEVRRSFELAARTLPLDIVYYDNAGDGHKALANADDAILRKVELLIEYHADLEANAAIGRKMRQAAIPVLAVNYPVPDAPLYTADNVAAGTIAGNALGDFAQQNWPDQNVVAVIVGDIGDPQSYVADRVRGITLGLREKIPGISLTQLDSSGNPARVETLLGKFLAAQPRRKVLIAALDDPSALSAKTSVEVAGRLSECVVVGQGVDRSMHGGASEKKELDPSNRASIVLGSVAYYLDRYGYDVLPLALRMLRGEAIPARTTTKHTLITARNIFAEYPPHDMN
jgi:ribose transport system substrate-binding protein